MSRSPECSEGEGSDSTDGEILSAAKDDSQDRLSPAFDETNMVAFREKKQEEEAKQQKRPVGTYSCSLEQEKVA